METMFNQWSLDTAVKALKEMNILIKQVLVGFAAIAVMQKMPKLLVILHYVAATIQNQVQRQVLLNLAQQNGTTQRQIILT
ncbi:MAG TPA: hypothetical protein ACHBX0_15355 [Arsenophonus sp.]